MINFDEELEVILQSDPLGLLDVPPKLSSVISADERLIASFVEINEFMREHTREPTSSRDIGERRLYSRLRGLRENPEKAAALKEFDSFNLLPQVDIPDPKEINSIDDILNDDALGLLGDDKAEGAGPGSIFDLKHVPKTVKMPDHIARRKPCAEFDQFEPLFKQMHADLQNGEKKTIPFTSERQIAPGEFFIVQGMLVYVANVGKWEKRNYGNVNARLYCVFENGTESNLLLRSLAAAFWKDENSRQIVESGVIEKLCTAEPVPGEDRPTGYIYILRSLSKDPQIREIDDLYKIGFSSQPAAERIQNAAQEPTYLMADVVVVSEFQTFNLNPQKLELLIHTFLAEACLNLDVFDGDGQRHTPREWFVAPLHVIETAIRLLINGEIVNYRYDCQRQEIAVK